ncbi:response regulator [Pseudomonas sp. NPDC089569]|uniref:response regulator n=1 Tax=Pseudomonas sp. NPDC089569 TaxID=3390722 RepID=UPI003CFF1B58
MSKVLIVEDSPTDSYLAQKCASELFDEVHAVFNVDDMSKALVSFRPSLLIVDLNLNDWKNGISLISEIRDAEEGNGRMPIIVLSSRKTPADKFHAQQAGASGYLVKPITVEALRNMAIQIGVLVTEPQTAAAHS